MNEVQRRPGWLYNLRMRVLDAQVELDSVPRPITCCPGTFLSSSFENAWECHKILDEVFNMTHPGRFRDWLKPIIEQNLGIADPVAADLRAEYIIQKILKEA